VPAGRLHLYRFIEDAWSGALSAWCESARDTAAVESWVLLENEGQARWLSRKLDAAGITGIRLFDAAGLRDALARLAAMDPLPRNAATAAFAAKVAAGPTLRNPAALVEASDTLARAGWHLNQLAFDPALARRVHRTLDHAAVIPGIFDRRLRAALNAIPARVCCIGWDARHWPDLALLDLAAEKAASFEMHVPSPRLPADALQREWIETLEQRLGLERLTSPESGFTSENEPLVARLENSQLAARAEAPAPLLLVGREWPDQVRLVTAQVLSWLKENPSPDAPVGIIAPEDSPTAIAVAEALASAGVSIEHPHRVPEPAGPARIIAQVARYHLSAHDVPDFLELTQLLWLENREAWRDLEPGPVREALDHAFQEAQSRNTRILAGALPRRSDPVWTAIRALVATLGRWDDALPWPALRKKWETLQASLRLPPETLGPEWPRIRALFRQEPIPGQDFMEWLAAQRPDTPAPDRFSPVPVVVTTFTHAAQQTWDRLIFLDSNEHIWPAPIAATPFLPDAIRVRLNSGRHDSAHLLTTRDLRSLDQARFLELIEHCRRSIAFAGVLLAPTAPGDHAQPNEWVLRALLETSGGHSAPDLWTAAAQAAPPEPPLPLDPDEHSHLARVHASRRNPLMPFDRYQFNYNETKLEPGAWSATDLDDAVTCPATFALRVLFDAEPTAAWSPTREEGAAVGNRAHRWLRRVLGVGDQLAPPISSPDAEARLFRELTAARIELEQAYAAEGLPVPIWWETCLRKTAWAARRCLREVRQWIDGRYCSMEQKLALEVHTPSGSLLLKGRIDILISDRPEIPGATLRMFDFKTGRGDAPSLATLARGKGAQFAAYYLMARDAGAAEAVIGIIKPEDHARDVFGPADEEALRARFSLLADLRRNLRFGQLGPLVSDYGECESLPMATLPIDPAILEQKAAHFLIAT